MDKVLSEWIALIPVFRDLFFGRVRGSYGNCFDAVRGMSFAFETRTGHSFVPPGTLEHEPGNTRQDIREARQRTIAGECA